MAGDNGVTYSGTYQNMKANYEPVSMSEEGIIQQRSSHRRRPWVIAGIVVLLGFAAFCYTQRPGAKTDSALSKSNLPVSKDSQGKLKLFDNNSKFFFHRTNVFFL